jgi:tetratricopeptide (TPR) repeat protein
VSSGTLLAGFTRDTDMARLGETTAEMARSVAGVLQVPVRNVKATTPIDADAMEAYVRGWSEYWRLTREGFLEAERLFTVTTTRAPGYAPAHAALAYVTFQLEKAYKVYPPGVGASAARNHGREALRLDPDSPQALAALGWIEFYGAWNWRQAEDLLLRAVDLNPSDAQSRWMYAQLLMAENRLDAALQEARLVQRLDPLTPARYSNVATVLYYDRQYDEALGAARQLLVRDPNATVGHFGMARFLAALDRHDEAIRMIQTSGNAGEPPVRAELARIFTVANRDAEARALLPGLEEDYRAGRLAPDYYAFVKLARRQPDEALRLLEQAVTERSPSVIWIQVDPRFDGLRQQPAFTALLRRIGLAS